MSYRKEVEGSSPSGKIPQIHVPGIKPYGGNNIAGAFFYYHKALLMKIYMLQEDNRVSFSYSKVEMINKLKDQLSTLQMHLERRFEDFDIYAKDLLDKIDSLEGEEVND